MQGHHKTQSEDAVREPAIQVTYLMQKCNARQKEKGGGTGAVRQLVFRNMWTLLEFHFK